MAAKQRRKRGARCNVGRPVSGGVGEIAPPVAGRGSSPRGDVSPPRNLPDLFVILLIELLGERVRERDQAAGLGPCIGLPQEKRVWQPSACGRRSTRSGGGCHTGEMKCGGVRIRHARSLRRGVRCAGRHRCRCGKRTAGTVAGRMRAAATKRSDWHRPQGLPHVRHGLSSAQRLVAGRFRSRYGVRMHAPRVLARVNARGSRWGCHTGDLKTAAGLPQRHRNKPAQ